MPSPTFIRRAPHRTAYVVVANATVRDEALSWGARGLLVYLLSLPDDWRVRQADLVARAPEGRTVVERLLRELIDAGYLRRSYEQTAAGRTVEILVYETPEIAEQVDLDLDGSRESREPTAENPRRGSRGIEEVPRDVVPRATRESRGAIYEALVAVFGEPGTRGARAFYGKIAGSLLDAGATRGETIERGEYMLSKGWRDAGPGALDKHWASLGRELSESTSAWWDRPGYSGTDVDLSANEDAWGEHLGRRVEERRAEPE